ncbi:MAG: hypothetical protein JWR90_412 [Marmoricola sp.]|nr:hypothetical protein [Marmoricola sp.]
MYRTLRVLLVALLALVLATSAPLAATADQGSGSLPTPSPNRHGFTHDDALDLLAKARRQLRPDTRRVRERKPVGQGASTDITMTLRDLYLARPLLTGEQRRQADAMLARPSDPDGDDLGGGAPVTYPTLGRAHWCPTGGIACIHWVTTGAERISTADADLDGVPDYAETVYATMAQVWNAETGTMGYRTPLPDDGTATDADNPDSKLDIYLADLGTRGLYGYCAPEGSAAARQVSGYCVLDNDFSRTQYGIAPINALRVTAAHEFFHAIQFGYDVDEDVWFMEGSAAWIEDEVYDAINDNYQFLRDSPIRYPHAPLDYSVGIHRYGAFLFFKYAAERLRDRNVVRQFWDAAAAPRDRFSLQSIRAVIAARHVSWATFFSVFASWNTLPAGSYSERGAYPAPAYALTKVLSTRSRAARTTGWRSLNLPHASSSTIRLVPNARLKPRKRVLVEVNAPNSARGATALIQRRFRNGTVTHAMMPLNSRGDGRALLGFDRRVISSIVVVVSNTSTTMRDCGHVGDGYGGPLYSCYGRGYFDRAQTYSVRATLR